MKLILIISVISVVSISMIIFLYGPDSFRSAKKLQDIIERYRNIHKSGLNFYTFDLEEDPFDSFLGMAESVSMFGEKKLIVLKNALKSKEFAKEFLEWEGKDGLKHDKEVVCVFLEKDTDGSSPLCKWLKNHSESQEFNALSGTRLKSWILNAATARGVSMDSAAVFTLMSFCGGDLWMLENEISKLASYVKQKDGKAVIGKLDIDIFLKAKPETRIFSLVDSFVEGDKKRALRLLSGHLESGDSEQYLFSMIHKQFRNIALACDFLASKESSYLKFSRVAGIHPFVAKKSIEQASRLKVEQIKKIYELLIDVDIKMKTGSASARHEIERLLF